MGLDLVVGILADLQGQDAEGVEYYQSCFAELNGLLAKARLDPHDEPTDCDVWSAGTYGASGLYCLRRLAAHLDAGKGLPSPGTSDSPDDPVLEAYYNDYYGKSPGFLGRLFNKPPDFSRQFDHLIIHSDAEGFYLPQEFDEVLVGPGDEVLGEAVGSAPRLSSELGRIAAELEIPADLHSQSDALLAVADSPQGEGASTWERYGVESFVCVVLREGCRHCVKTGAALLFC